MLAKDGVPLHDVEVFDLSILFELLLPKLLAEVLRAMVVLYADLLHPVCDAELFAHWAHRFEPRVTFGNFSGGDGRFSVRLEEAFGH